jgi:curved DNA-binding protein CbpA
VFKDYYIILEIPFGATNEQVKSAFKKQAFRWHPDKNPSTDTKDRMQDINEAYLILKDSEARIRYDKEYEYYKSYQNLFKESFSPNKETSSEKRKSHEYQFHDDILKKWMSNARMQASRLVSQTIKEINIGAKAAGKEMIKQSIAFAIIGIIFFIISRSCH